MAIHQQVATNADGKKSPRIGAIYNPSVPGHRDLFEALAEHTHVRAIAPAAFNALTDRRTSRRVKPCYVPIWPADLPWRKVPHHWLVKKLIGSIDVIVYTRPDQAPLLPAFKGIYTVYLVNDDYSQYGRAKVWEEMEGELLQRADLIIAVSQALAERLIKHHHLTNPNIHVLPNAVPASHVPGLPQSGPWALPEGMAHIKRPVAGVLGRISSRIRLDWLEQAIEATPWLQWVLAGDIDHGDLLEQDRSRISQLANHPRVTMTGFITYDQLASIAASIDVAVIPYSERSVNPLGSPMRLFLHLPHGTPIIATTGCKQITDFVPLVLICNNPEEMIKGLETLRNQAFDDGQRKARWLAASQHTWEHRALELLALVDQR